jgi:hypothetical protein
MTTYKYVQEINQDMARPTNIVLSTARATFSVALSMILFVCCVSEVRAQDSFEVQVYESEIVPKNHSELDVHTLFVQRGGSTWEGTVAPSDKQAHLAFEFTRGISEEFELGGYLLFAHRPGEGTEYAGFRLRPRVRAPDAWGSPVGLSLSVEIGFPQLLYEPNHVTLEIRPIIDKKVGRWRLSVNPDLTFAFDGPGAKEGMGLEPELMIAYDAVPDQLMLMVEYFTALGPAHHLLPSDEQAHLIYPQIEYSFSEALTVNAGVGLGLTDASDSFTWAVRLMLSF